MNSTLSPSAVATSCPQREYALTPHDGINQYAQEIISNPGKQDGLYWKNADGASAGPIGEAVANAIEESYSLKTKGGFHGYYFKILKGQGPDAPMGKINYVLEGVMIGGFALVAVPAEYRVTVSRLSSSAMTALSTRTTSAPIRWRLPRRWSSAIPTRLGSQPTMNGLRRLADHGTGPAIESTAKS